MTETVESERLEAMPIFDIDTHFAEQPDLWTSRAPAKYVGKVLQVQEEGTGKQSWFIDNHPVGMIGPSVVREDMTKEMNAYTLPTFEEMSRASTYAPERMAYMDTMNIGSQIMYPNIIGFGAQKLMEISDDVELRLWHVQTYNDAIVDLQKEGGGRLLPQAALPLWDIEASVTELHRIRKLGLTGVAMSDKPQDFGQPPLSDPAWGPLFEACQELDMPINFHIGSGNWSGDVEKWWLADRGQSNPDGSLNGRLGTFTSVSLFIGMSGTLMNLILGGLLEQYPRLKFVIVESGAGWLPFAIQGIEWNWREMFSTSDRAMFKREPREMFLDQIFCSYWFENRNSIDYFLNEFGPNNLLFETDFPHPTSLYPGVKNKVNETLGDRPVETQRKILYQNAEKLYGIKVGQIQKPVLQKA